MNQVCAPSFVNQENENLVFVEIYTFLW